MADFYDCACGCPGRWHFEADGAETICHYVFSFGYSYHMRETGRGDCHCTAYRPVRKPLDVDPERELIRMWTAREYVATWAANRQVGRWAALFNAWLSLPNPQYLTFLARDR